MEDFFSRALDQLLSRPAGPFHLRFIVEPVIAAILAIRAGLKDARAHQPPYLWTVFTEPAQRQALIRHGWKDVGRVFIIAFVLDGVYQIVEFSWFYPLQAVIVAFVLAIIPYVLIRGPVTRIASRVLGRGGQPAPAGR